MNQKVWWATGALATGLLIMTGYAVVSGDGDGGKKDEKAASPQPSRSSGGAKPTATYAPPDEWSEPGQWAALPRGTREDPRGNLVKFPHTRLGAVSMLSSATSMEVEGERSYEQEQLSLYRSYTSDTDLRTTEEEFRTWAKSSAAQLRRSMKLPPGNGPLPEGAYMRSHTVGFKVVSKKSEDDQAWVWLLNRTTTRKSETAKEKGSYARILTAAKWEDGDWKQSSAAIKAAYAVGADKDAPQIAAPGDGKFTDAGWTAIREAS